MLRRYAVLAIPTLAALVAPLLQTPTLKAASPDRPHILMFLDEIDAQRGIRPGELTYVSRSRRD